MELILPAGGRRRSLQAAALTGLALIVVIDWRIANRWERERSNQAS
jgi:hypothetical protein